MTFGYVLRELRKRKFLTQKQLGDSLGISESAVGMYERGKREPDFETLEVIADYFNVDMDYLTGRSPVERKYTFSANPTAYEMVVNLCKRNDISLEYLSEYTDIPIQDIKAFNYRETSIPSYEIANKLAAFFDVSPDAFNPETFSEALPRASKQIREIDCVYDALNADGQHELCKYGRYLGTQEQYKAIDGEPQIEYIRHYLTAAAAGYAAPIEGEDYELVPRDISVPVGADFCIDIDGDSMELYIKHGQRVYVQQNVSLKEFEVGIFFVDGDVYCKQWCVDYAGTLHLLSANPKREDANISVPRDSGRSVVCFGKVLVPKLPQPDPTCI